MFLSRLILNSLSRQVCRELAEPYEMHRTIMSAFPNDVRVDNERVLFRVDTIGNPAKLNLLVQSYQKPDWQDRLLETYLLDKPEVKEFRPVFSNGQTYFFRLRANPTVKRNGKRYGWLKEEDQLSWLQRKGMGAGFRPLSVTVIPEGMIKSKKWENGQQQPINFLAVRFEGSLVVVDPEAFLQAVKSGIGSAKGLGFGLLSLRRKASPDAGSRFEG